MRPRCRGRPSPSRAPRETHGCRAASSRTPSTRRTARGPLRRRGDRRVSAVCTRGRVCSTTPARSRRAHTRSAARGRTRRGSRRGIPPSTGAYVTRWSPRGAEQVDALRRKRRTRELEGTLAVDAAARLPVRERREQQIGADATVERASSIRSSSHTAMGTCSGSHQAALISSDKIDSARSRSASPRTSRPARNASIASSCRLPRRRQRPSSIAMRARRGGSGMRSNASERSLIASSLSSSRSARPRARTISP